MKGRLFVVASVLFSACFLSVYVHGARSSSGDPASGRAGSIAVLPESLDQLYPPAARGPVLLAAMHDLNAALAGIVVDVSENDREGAVANFERFDKQYREIARLVPEWESWYPTEPLDGLKKAVGNGSPDDVMAAVDRVGAVCHTCHTATMAPVQFKYHWPDFGAITVHDPLSNTDVEYPGFMQMLNASLAGVAIDLDQGQLENARSQFAALRSRMAELRGSCDGCHDTRRAYFVDERIESLLADMGTALDADEPDPTVVVSLSRRIGEESCTRCHMIHLPAAYSRYAYGQ